MTPNYKVDKKALPYPDAAELAAAAMASTTASDTLTPTQKMIREHWSTQIKLPPEAIDLDDDFFEIGGHSLLAQNMLYDLKCRTNKGSSMAALVANSTLRGFAATIDNAGQEVNGISSSRKVRYHPFATPFPYDCLCTLSHCKVGLGHASTKSPQESNQGLT